MKISCVISYSALQSSFSQFSRRIAMLVTLTASQWSHAQTVVQADQFVDSVGINVHLHYTNTPYATNFPLIQSSLQSLGVRHLRDGLILDSWKTYDVELSELGQLGIKGIFITSPGQTAAQINTFQSLVPNAFEGVESPNEYDESGVANWAAVLQNSAPVIDSSVTRQYPEPMVIGPSLVKCPSYSTVGSLAPLIAYGNIHDYKAWQNPGTPGSYGCGYGNYLSNAWALSMESIVAPSLPVIATETGYTNATNTANYVPTDVSAVYLPRLLLEQYRAGIKRTYLYELLSEGGEDYGLLTSTGAQKPAFPAVANLLNMLSDPGPAFTPDTFPVTISGGNANVHSVLFEKRNKVFYLAVWIELPRYNGATSTPGKAVVVSPQPLTLTLGSPVQSAILNQWDATGNVTPSTLATSQTLNITATDELQIVELVPAAASSAVSQAKVSTTLHK